MTSFVQVDLLLFVKMLSSDSNLILLPSDLLEEIEMEYKNMKKRGSSGGAVDLDDFVHLLQARSKRLAVLS